MQKKLGFTIAAAAFLGLAACDEIDSDLERAAIGAAAGCVAGEILVDGKCIQGGVMGAAGGALIDDVL